MHAYAWIDIRRVDISNAIDGRDKVWIELSQVDRCNATIFG